MGKKRAGGPLICVTGIQAAGKSTVARRLAARFERGVHIEADALQRMIVSGGEQPGEPGPLSEEVVRQLRLRLHNACLVARSFVDAGFAVVVDDIILGERWDHLQEELAGCEFSLVVLAPRLEVVAEERDRGRQKAPIGREWAAYLDGELRRTMAGQGLWVDSSRQTAEETVAEIVGRLGSRKSPR